MWVPQEELLRALAASSTDSVSAGFCSQKVVGTYLPGTGILGWGAWCGSGTSCSQSIPPEFLSTWVWGHPFLCPRPSYQSGWMWFLQCRSCQTFIQLDF